MKQKSMKVLAFPYDMELYPILKNRQLLKDIDIKFLARPKGWRKKENDFQIPVVNEIDDVLEQVDAIWVVNSCQSLDFCENILPIIKKAVDLNKKIIISRDLKESDYALIDEMSEEAFCNIERKRYNQVSGVQNQEYMYEITVPVVIIVGVTDNTNKMQIQFDLYKRILSQGFSPCLITSRNWNLEYIGDIEEMPRFMFEQKISYKDKIVEFNHYIKKMEKIKKPDLFIIGVPGEAVNYSNRILQNMGEIAKEIVMAVPPDISILSTTYQKFTYPMLEQIVDEVERKLGIEVDYCNVVNRMIDMDKVVEEEIIDFLFLNTKYVEEKVSEMDVNKVYYLENDDECNRITNDIIRLLSSETTKIY